MKRLILGRHSYTEYPGHAKDDLKRKLTGHGQEIAFKQMQKIKNLNIKVDIIISSHAERAIETANIYQKELALPKAYLIESFLYDYYTTDQFINLIASQDNALESILIVAHNPSISEIAYRLTPDFNLGMQPATLAIIDFDVKSWKAIEVYEGKLVQIITP